MPANGPREPSLTDDIRGALQDLIAQANVLDGVLAVGAQLPGIVAARLLVGLDRMRGELNQLAQSVTAAANSKTAAEGG